MDVQCQNAQGNFVQESTLIEQLYDEYSKVSGCPEYLASVQKNKNSFGRISIFGNPDIFSARNAQKSAADYEALRGIQICWQPSKGITIAMESHITLAEE